jgi:hypothetical protein
MDVEGLVDAIEFAYDVMVENVGLVWEERCAGANEGQNVLYEHYIFPIQEEIFEYWGQEWPWVEPAEWFGGVMDSHYANEFAWSDTIEQLYKYIENTVYSAQEKAIWLEFLDIFI